MRPPGTSFTLGALWLLRRNVNGPGTVALAGIDRLLRSFVASAAVDTAG